MIGARRALEAKSLSEVRQRTVDLPQQHRSAGRGAAVPRQFAIDDHDIEALSRQAFRDQRSGDPGANNQRIAFDVFADLTAGRMPGRRIPR